MFFKKTVTAFFITGLSSFALGKAYVCKLKTPAPERLKIPSEFFVVADTKNQEGMLFKKVVARAAYGMKSKARYDRVKTKKEEVLGNSYDGVRAKFVGEGESYREGFYYNRTYEFSFEYEVPFAPSHPYLKSARFDSNMEYSRTHDTVCNRNGPEAHDQHSSDLDCHEIEPTVE